MSVEGIGIRTGNGRMGKRSLAHSLAGVSFFLSWNARPGVGGDEG